jgi:uncharacterized protein YaaR (DUF327 family)
VLRTGSSWRAVAVAIAVLAASVALADIESDIYAARADRIRAASDIRAAVSKASAAERVLDTLLPQKAQFESQIKELQAEKEAALKDLQKGRCAACPRTYPELVRQLGREGADEHLEINGRIASTPADFERKRKEYDQKIMTIQAKLSQIQEALWQRQVQSANIGDARVAWNQSAGRESALRNRRWMMEWERFKSRISNVDAQIRSLSSELSTARRKKQSTVVLVLLQNLRDLRTQKSELEDDLRMQWRLRSDQQDVYHFETDTESSALRREILALSDQYFMSASQIAGPFYFIRYGIPRPDGSIGW